MIINNFPGLIAEQKFTSPPSRYSDASLSKTCEKEQIARPATFGNFIKILQDRGYIVREKKTFHPTDLGIKVIDFLKAANMCFVDLAFTAQMEDKLDDIQEAKIDKVAVLNDFWERLQHDIANGNQIKSNAQKSEHKCPKCGGYLMLKHSVYGAFYSCENYKGKKAKDGCTFLATLDENGNPVEKKKKEAEYLDFVCDKCGAKMQKRTGAWGDFAGCSKFPKCRRVASLDGVFKDPAPKKWKKNWKGKKNG